MYNKKLLSLLIAIIVVTLLPFHAFAENAASTSGQSDTDRMKTGNGKMIMTQSLMKLDLGKGPSDNTAMEEKMKKLEQRIKIKNQAFKFKLTRLKDIKKKTGLLNIDTKISSISGHATMLMSDAIDRMNVILKKVEDKATIAKSQGVNTLALDNAISDANAALASASAAVTTQSTKTYEIPVTTDEAAKSNAGQTVSQMQSDLRQTHQTVMKAKQAVMKTLVELKKIWKDVKPVSMTPTAAITQQPSPTTGPTATVAPTATLVPTNATIAPTGTL
jgi:hypothetical protein